MWKSSVRCVCVCVSHRLAVQLLVDLDDPSEWVNEEVVVSVSADDGVEDGSVLLTVDVLSHQLPTHRCRR